MTRCYNMYRSDFSGALSLQIISSLILIYFANITQAFTFGAVLSDHTNSTLVCNRVVGGLMSGRGTCQVVLQSRD